MQFAEKLCLDPTWIFLALEQKTFNSVSREINGAQSPEKRIRPL
ncbi:hypothetical protein NUZ5A_50938 [Candidatus Nitrosotenuis uzonensis]|uniref:Uncharacterized protein n=1 Tax=Candidatus Nitrosotenuis uzonensis TaxID=1407055 RepID=A0A812F3H6_9ARCH|nr:hypothetical protein NUZ5A_50938 [Candidatus Nitrosotenuis uzonensis]